MSTKAFSYSMVSDLNSEWYVLKDDCGDGNGEIVIGHIYAEEIVVKAVVAALNRLEAETRDGVVLAKGKRNYPAGGWSSLHQWLCGIGRDRELPQNYADMVLIKMHRMEDGESDVVAKAEEVEK